MKTKLTGDYFSKSKWIKSSQTLVAYLLKEKEDRRIFPGDALYFLWRPVAARHDANAFSTLASAVGAVLEGFQEGYQVGSFLARENEAQMSLVVANHIFDRRGDSVVEVRRAGGEGA